jgi:hypothetical protein
MFINEEERDSNLKPLVFNEILEREQEQEEKKEEEEVVEQDDDLFNEVNTEILSDTSNIVEQICYIIEYIYEMLQPTWLWLRNLYNENIKVKSE